MHYKKPKVSLVNQIVIVINVCHPECNEGSQDEKPADSSLRSE